MIRPRIKICGVTTVADALHAARLGADYLGLNFYPPSPRALDPERAAEIAAAVRTLERPPVLVGVFVDRPRREIETIDRQVGLDLVQLHGAERPDEVRPFAPRAIKVLKVRGRLDPERLAVWENRIPELWGFLVDYHHETLVGGTGRGWDFASLRGPRPAKPVFIAGGLDPASVGAAIAAARPWGIDLCSGVESTPGHKDPALLDRLFREVSAAETEI